MKYLFGPVMSRRLGVSLGIDLLPNKTCTLDCIYCECGATTKLSCERAEFIPTDTVINELDSYLKEKPQLDYITFAGSGEPTLHTGIGDIIRHIKQKYPRYKVAVLTNGTLLGDENVQYDISEADLVVPSLDGATDKSFNSICRPAQGISYRSAIDAISDFRRVYKGKLSLEIFIIPGINDSYEEIIQLKAAADRIMPDEIQLNTLSRPGTVEGLSAVSNEKMIEISDYFAPIPVVCAVLKESKQENTVSSDPEGDILNLLQRRAANIDDMICATGMNRTELKKIIESMIYNGTIERSGETNYISAKQILK